MPGLVGRTYAADVGRVVQLSGRSAASGDLTNAISACLIRSEQAVHAAGIPWTIVRPLAFASNALRWLPHLRASDGAGTVRKRAGGEPRPVRHRRGRGPRPACDKHAGRTYELSGPEPRLPADQVRILGQVLGRKLRFGAQYDDEARAEMSAAVS